VSTPAMAPTPDQRVLNLVASGEKWSESWCYISVLVDKDKETCSVLLATVSFFGRRSQKWWV